MSKKDKKACAALNYIEHWLVLASEVTGYFSIPVFASLVCIPVGITSSAIGLKNLLNNCGNWKVQVNN